MKDLWEIRRLLVVAKSKLPHGEWIAWVEGECEFSDRTARRLMEAYRDHITGLGEIWGHANRTPASVLTPRFPPEDFTVVYADPPWRCEHPISDTRQIENQYPTKELEEIKASPVPSSENAISSRCNCIRVSPVALRIGEQGVS